MFAEALEEQGITAKGPGAGELDPRSVHEWYGAEQPAGK